MHRVGRGRVPSSCPRVSEVAAARWAIFDAYEYNGPGWLPTGGQIFSSTAPQGTGYRSAQEDALIAETHQPAANNAQFLKVFDRYEAYTAQQLPFLWLPNQATIDVVSPHVHGAVRWGNPVTNDPEYNHTYIIR